LAILASKHKPNGRPCMDEEGEHDPLLPTHDRASDRGTAPRQEPDIAMTRRHLQLLAGEDAAHTFQPYYDPDPKAPETAWMSKRLQGRLEDVWPKILELQQKGAAIAVTMAETDGRGRKNANMVRPRAVWIEADNGLQRALPLPPTMTDETSPGHYHYIYVARDLTWELWHGVQQTLIADYGSDARAGLRTQVLRLAGTLHQKDLARPHLVRIVADLTSERVYTAAEIAEAFPPRPTPLSRRRSRSSSGRARGGAAGITAEEWQLDKILAAFRAIDARLRESGAFIAQGDRPDDQPIEVDWSLRSWWLRALACLHHASGGSEEGFRLSCAVSGGNESLGLTGCPSKFDASDQRRVWESLTVDRLPELRGVPLTIRTIYWVARRNCGWQTKRRGRPRGQPRLPSDISDQAKAVAEAGSWAVANGLDRVRELHAAVASQRVKKGTLMDRILDDIRTRLATTTGVAAIGSLASVARTLGCATETLRSYLRQLAACSLIVKNDGNSTSLTGTSGITIALGFPEGLREAIKHPPSSATSDPPISDQTGIPIPQISAEPGRNPSRSPYSHEVGHAAVMGEEEPRSGVSPETSPGGAPEWTLGDWIEARVILPDISDHLERCADKWGRNAVSRVLVRIEELRKLLPSPEEVRSQLERAGDMAARKVVKKTAKDEGLEGAEVEGRIKQACPACIPPEGSIAFVRELAGYLDPIIREARGDPDPWRKRWRDQRQVSPAPTPKRNAYAEAGGSGISRNSKREEMAAHLLNRHPLEVKGAPKGLGWRLCRQACLSERRKRRPCMRRVTVVLSCPVRCLSSIYGLLEVHS
jgi:hypothetical protein